MKSLRILLADDHEMLRRGLRAALTECPGWQICGEAANGRQAVELARQLQPNVVIMDIAMPELNGLEATRRIRRALPNTEVLILTFDESEEIAREVLAAGARGYVLKNDVGRVLIEAVESLSEHRTFFTPKITEVSLRTRPHGVEPADPLTDREREIVQLVAEGKSSKAVADTLGISVKTAENHRANIMRKLNLRSATELVRYAIRNRIITP